MRDAPHRVLARVRLPLLVVVLVLAASGGTTRAVAKSGRAGPKVLLGDTAVAGLRDLAPAGAPRIFRYRAIRSGAATSIFVYVDRGSGANTLTAGVYADVHGRPGKLMAAGSRRSRATGRWTRVTLSSAQAVVRGRAYWLAVRGTGGPLSLRVRGSRADGCSEDSARAVARLPVEWSGRRSSGTCSLSAYATGLLKPVNTAPPVITGSTAVGQYLTATAGSWRNTPSVHVYQWQLCLTSSAYCLDIPGATEKTYLLLSNAVGLRVRIVVGVANAAGVALTASALTATVSPAPGANGSASALSNTVLPTLSGEAVQGHKLTATTGTWSVTPTGYAYQWEDCDTSGAACSNIAGANSSTYTLAAADVGHTIRSVVAAFDSSGGASATTGPSDVVSAAAMHTETWGFDDCSNGGVGATAALVRQWLTYAETNCGSAGDTKGLADCHSSGVIYCQVIQYLDTNIMYYSSGDHSDQWPAWSAVAQENWYLHEASPHQSTRISTTAYGGGYYDNVANPSVVAFYQSYVRENYPAQDGLMMDDTAAGIPELDYSTNDQGATSTNEITSSAQLQAAHETLQNALTKPDGSTYIQITNGLAAGGNPAEPFSGVGPTGNQITATAPGLITEGNPEDNGSMDTYYAGLLDDMAYIDASTSGFIVLESYATSGASYQQQSRLVQEATVLLGYEPGGVVDWANLELGNSDLSIWPEEGIYPTNPVQTMANPGGTGCLAGTNVYCPTGGHNDVQVASGVYRREFADCYDQGSFFGTCAAIVNSTGSPVTVASTWLTQAYGHSITLSGGDVESGGTINLTGAAFTAGSTQVAAHSALILTGT